MFQNVVQPQTEDKTRLKIRDPRQDCSGDFNDLETEKKPSRRSEDSSEAGTHRKIYTLLVGFLKAFQQAILADIDRTTENFVKYSNRLSVLGDSANRKVGT
jgi:hypothetical protein